MRYRTWLPVVVPAAERADGTRMSAEMMDAEPAWEALEPAGEPGAGQPDAGPGVPQQGCVCASQGTASHAVQPAVSEPEAASSPAQAPATTLRVVKPAPASRGDDEPVILLNAMRNRPDVYVLADGKPVRLPRAPEPLMMDSWSQRRSQQVLVAESAADGATRGRVADIGVCTEPVPVILRELPEMDGVWYLVDTDAKAQYPNRDDFVVPAYYGMWTSPKLERALRSKDKRKRRKARRKDASTFTHAKRFPLAAVATGPLPVAGPGTPVLSLDDPSE